MINDWINVSKMNNQSDKLSQKLFPIEWTTFCPNCFDIPVYMYIYIYIKLYLLITLCEIHPIPPYARVFPFAWHIFHVSLFIHPIINWNEKRRVYKLNRPFRGLLMTMKGSIWKYRSRKLRLQRGAKYRGKKKKNGKKRKKRKEKLNWPFNAARGNK